MHALIMRATNEWSWNSITMRMRLRCGLSDIFFFQFLIREVSRQVIRYLFLILQKHVTCWVSTRSKTSGFFLTLILRWKSLFLSISDLVVTEDCAHMKTRSIKDLRALHIGSQLFKGTASRRFSPFRLVMPNDTL